MQQQQNFQPRKKTILSDYRMPLPASVSPLEGARNPAQFQWELKNNGKIVFRVNDGVYKPGVKTTHKEVELDYSERGVLFEALREAVKNKDFVNKQVAVRKKDFVFTGGRGQMSDQPILKATFTIRRDERGVIYWGYSKGDYKVEVIFNGPNDCVIYYKDEQGQRREDHGALSRYYAMTYVRFHEPILNRMEEEHWTPPKPKEGTGNGNGGGNNYGGGNGGNNNYGGGGNNQAPSTDFDDDDLDF